MSSQLKTQWPRPLNSSAYNHTTHAAMAQELLQKVRSGAKQGSITLKDVEEILSNADFTSGEGLLATTGTDNEVSGCYQLK